MAHTISHWLLSARLSFIKIKRVEPSPDKHAPSTRERAPLGSADVAMYENEAGELRFVLTPQLTFTTAALVLFEFHLFKKKLALATLV